MYKLGKEILHDRFWIFNRNRGTLSGIFVNGLGGRISNINKLPEYDCNELYNILVEENIIDR